VLKPLKAAIKRLKGHRNSRRFSTITKIILVFKYILNYYEQRVKVYEVVNYNTYNKAPKDYLAINLRVVTTQARQEIRIRRSLT
jgi:hypothetical protein